MKYVILKDPKSGWKHPIIFSDFVTHSQVEIKGMVPISAGFINLKERFCFGESESLKLKSLPGDFQFVAAMLTNNNAIMAIQNAEEITT